MKELRRRCSPTEDEAIDRGGMLPIVGRVARDDVHHLTIDCFAAVHDVVPANVILPRRKDIRSCKQIHSARRPFAGSYMNLAGPDHGRGNRGIGTAMLRRLILSARNRKIQHLRMNCHGQNQAMQELARKFKADLRIDHAETVGDIIPRAATPFSVLMEALDDAREFGQAAIDVRRRLRLQSGRKAPLVK